MSEHTTLYRKYRSQTLGQLVGQDVITTIIKNALTQKTLAHAYLLCGPRGTGKTSTARIIAKAINCKSPVGVEPCNVCDLCKKITAGTCVDVLEVDAASNRGIDEMRGLREQIHFQPMEAAKKIYIIDEVHMLTDAAFNALLKTLEEPPAHVIFLLATTDPQKVPVTIRSRCQTLFFRKIGTPDIIKQLAYVLKNEGRSASVDALQTMAEVSDGGMRDALSLLEQLLAVRSGEISSESVSELLGIPPVLSCQTMLDQAMAGDLGAAFETLAELLRQGSQAAEILKTWVNLFKQQLLASGAAAAPVRMLDICFEVDKQIRWHEDKQLLLELALSKFYLAAGKTDRVQASDLPDIAAARVPQVPKQTVQAPSEKSPIPNPQSASTGQPTLAEIKHRWKDILSELRSIKLGLYMLASEGEPVAIEHGTLWLAYPSGQSFIKENMAEEVNRRKVEDVLLKKFLVPLKLKAVMQGQGPNQGSGVRSQGSASGTQASTNAQVPEHATAPVTEDELSPEALAKVFDGQLI